MSVRTDDDVRVGDRVLVHGLRGTVIATGAETRDYPNGGGADDIAIRDRHGDIHCRRVWQAEVLP